LIGSPTRSVAAVAGLKTTRNDADVGAFLASIPDETRRGDGLEICALMEEVTGEPPAMWGSSIVGFGQYRYVSGSGREADWFLTGFSPRKQSLTLYVMDGFGDYATLLGRLGPHRTGKACLYLKRLSDADPEVLRTLIERSVEHVRKRHLGPSAR
jgi:Domain of unknown function (DU1801)